MGETTVPQGSVAKFYDVGYAVPPALSAGKQKLTERFQATGGNEIAPVLGVRIIRQTQLSALSHQPSARKADS